jgi:hypothetical protein
MGESSKAALLDLQETAGGSYRQANFLTVSWRIQIARRKWKPNGG